MSETVEIGDKPNILIAIHKKEKDIRELCDVWFGRYYNLTIATSAAEAFGLIQSRPMFAAVVSTFAEKEANVRFLSQVKNHDIGYANRIVMFTCPCSPVEIDKIGVPVVCKGSFEPLKAELKNILSAKEENLERNLEDECFRNTALAVKLRRNPDRKVGELHQSQV